jgi:Zn-dependent protease with chaperone function
LAVDFFDRQEASHRATRYLVLLFGGAFLAVGLATGIVLLLMLGFANNGAARAVSSPSLMALVADSLDTFAIIVAAVIGLMIIASLFRAATLSQGGGHVARMLGGTRISSDDTNPTHRRLINVVEEMAIASGLPVPEIYVLEAERGINAFAAGRTPADAAIAVTRGSLEQLNRAELQGVIAHEFSHILNGDMQLNLRLMGFSFGILVLALVGRWMLRASARGLNIGRRGKGSPAIFIGLALLIIGGIGIFFSRLIKASVSRQRERLADASAVQFTREPLALAGALKKIGGFTPYLETVETEEVSHMLFGSAGRSFRGLFATHPPLPERIKALDPSFEPGDYIAPITPGAAAGSAMAEPAMAESALAAAGVSRLSGEAGAIRVESAGTIEPERGTALRAAIPTDIIDAAHSAQSAWLLVLALGVERGGATEAERRLIDTQLGPERAARCHALRRALDTLDPGLRLPVFELAVPALKQRPREQIDFLFELLEKLAAVDGEQSLDEYLLLRMLRAHFEAGEGLRASPRQRLEAARGLLASLAVAGQHDPDAAGAAYAAGLAVLGTADADSGQLTRARNDTSFSGLDDALARLQSAPIRERRRILTALAVTMRHDGKTGVVESELFRTIAAALDCPVPPASVIG